MDQGLQRLGDLTLVLVERVEHFAQLVAPAVDLVSRGTRQCRRVRPTAGFAASLRSWRTPSGVRAFGHSSSSSLDDSRSSRTSPSNPSRCSSRRTSRSSCSAVPLRGDESGKLLEAGECLLGVAHQAEVQTEPAVGPCAGARAGVQVIHKDRRIVADRGRVELEQLGRLLVAEHVDRLGWVQPGDVRDLLTHRLRHRAVPPGVDEKDVEPLALGSGARSVPPPDLRLGRVVGLSLGCGSSVMAVSSVFGASGSRAQSPRSFAIESMKRTAF